MCLSEKPPLFHVSLSGVSAWGYQLCRFECLNSYSTYATCPRLQSFTGLSTHIQSDWQALWTCHVTTSRPSPRFSIKMYLSLSLTQSMCVSVYVCVRDRERGGGGGPCLGCTCKAQPDVIRRCFRTPTLTLLVSRRTYHDCAASKCPAAQYRGA